MLQCCQSCLAHWILQQVCMAALYEGEMRLQSGCSLVNILIFWLQVS